ncbi:hypothetical protein Plhal304r1_c006g0024991 [Plasmopara halstedii]
MNECEHAVIEAQSLSISASEYISSNRNQRDPSCPQSDDGLLLVCSTYFDQRPPSFAVKCEYEAEPIIMEQLGCTVTGKGVADSSKMNILLA